MYDNNNLTNKIRISMHTNFGSEVKFRRNNFHFFFLEM